MNKNIDQSMKEDDQNWIGTEIPFNKKYKLSNSILRTTNNQPPQKLPLVPLVPSVLLVPSVPSVLLVPSVPSVPLDHQPKQVYKSTINESKSQTPMINAKYKQYHQLLNKTLKQQNNGSPTKSKSPTQLMQDILKGLSGRDLGLINPYYNTKSEQLLSHLLTNKHQLNNFIKDLEQQMPALDPQIVKTYEILIILLQQTAKSDIQVQQSEKGFQIKFNRSVLEKQELEIERLEKEIQNKDKTIETIVEEYEGVITQFNQVFEKMLSK